MRLDSGAIREVEVLSRPSSPACNRRDCARGDAGVGGNGGEGPVCRMTSTMRPRRVRQLTVALHHVPRVNHHQAIPARTSRAMVPPQSHATKRRDRRSNCEAPSTLRSRISESACQMRATSSINSPSIWIYCHELRHESPCRSAGRPVRQGNSPEF